MMGAGSQCWRQISLLLALLFVISGCWAAVIDTNPQEFSRNTGEREYVYLECHATGLQAGQTVTWTLLDHDVTISVGNNLTHADVGKYEIDKPQIGQGQQAYWNLGIRNLKVTDAGQYRCKVTGTDQFVTHTLKILDAPPTMPSRPLNVTDCCIEQNIDSCALPLCDQNSPPLVLLGIITNATCIDPNLLRLLSCGIDQRNHVGCCIRSGVTAWCEPLCGSSQKPEHLDRDYTQCMAQGFQIMSCFNFGQVHLPSAPTFVSARSLFNGFMVTWSAPEENADLVTGYNIMYKKKSEDTFITSTHSTQQPLLKTFSSLEEDEDYEVKVAAFSEYGASVPSYTVDVATKSSVNSSGITKSIQECCQSRNVSTKCQEYCQAGSLQMGIHPDNVESCYGELNTIFTCLIGRNITPCCNREGVPAGCLKICSGTIISSEFTLLPCMTSLQIVASCAVEGAGILPSAPVGTHLVPGSVTSNSAIIEWSPPDDGSAESYMIAWKPDRSTSSYYSTVSVTAGYQHQLTGLEAATLYQVFVVSENQQGSSLPDVTILFVTEGKTTVVPQQHNETECCRQTGVPDSCLEICNHTFRMTDAATLVAFRCSAYLMQMLLCGTDGRDHTHCCQEAGVSDHCLGLCKLRPYEQLVATDQLIACALEKDALSTCFDEGKLYLPKMPELVRIVKHDTHSLTVNWNAPAGPNATSYVVEYSTDERAQSWPQATSDHTFITLTKLEPSTVYFIRVYSKSNNYNSLPTNIVGALTLPVPLTDLTIDYGQVWQNRTHCCDNIGLNDTCKAVCYTGMMTDQQCFGSIDKIIACGADGRDHTRCCAGNAGFPASCLPYCAGQAPAMDARLVFCIPYTPAILTCFMEGQGTLPTPPQSFRVTRYTENSITVAWDKPASNCDTPSCSYTLTIWEAERPEKKNRTSVRDVTSYTFTLYLKSSTKYWVVAVARNQYGQSLQSDAVLVFTRADPMADIQVSQNPNGVYGVVDVGTSVTLQCTVSNTIAGIPRVRWIRNANTLTAGNVAQLDDIDVSDEGNYTCEVRYANGNVQTKDLHLNIMYRPFAVNIKEESVFPGLNLDAFLTCEFRGFPDTIYWSKDGSPVIDYPKYYVHPLEKNYNTGVTVGVLQVLFVTTDDYGEYTCVGHNKFGNNTKGLTGTLRYDYPTPPPLPTVSPNVSVAQCCAAEGVSQDCATDICTFSVDIDNIASSIHCLQYLQAYLYCGADHRDHTKCCRESGIHEMCLPFCKGEMLDINGNTDLYQCVQHIGTALKCAEDGHKFIPTHPRAVSISMNYNQMVIHWTEPLENADKVNIYEISYQRSTDTEPKIARVSKSLTSYAADDVQKNDQYNVSVIAKNNYGQSKPSATITYQITTVTPSEPINFQMSLVEQVYIRVQWDPPRSTVPVVFYRIFYKPKMSKEQYVVATTPTITERLGPMPENTDYMIYVVAYSDDGAGKSTETKTITTGAAVILVSPPSPPGTSEKTVGLAVGLTLALVLLIAVAVIAVFLYSEKTVGMAVGLTLALVLLIAVAVIAVFLYRRMASKSLDDGNTVAFENPQYGNRTGVKISGLPGSSEADNQFAYTTLQEDRDVEHPYRGHDGENGSHAYDNPLAGGSEQPATLKLDQ